MTGTLAVEMAVLLRPELLVDRASLDQHAMRREVGDLTVLHDQYLVAIGQ